MSMADALAQALSAAQAAAPSTTVEDAGTVSNPAPAAEQAQAAATADDTPDAARALNIRPLIDMADRHGIRCDRILDHIGIDIR